MDRGPRNGVFGLVKNPRPPVRVEANFPCPINIPQTRDPAFRFLAFLFCWNIKRNAFPTHWRFSLPDASR